MPPRPRPRPANRQASAPTQHATSSSKPVPIAKTGRELELDKGDELFIRNRNRTAKDWQRLDRIAKGEPRDPFSSLERDSDADELSDDASGSPRKRRRPRQREGSELPEWTRQTDVTLLAPDDESDLEVFDVASQDVDDSHPVTANSTNKRPRSRSRSLTPPPGLSMQQILHVRNLVSTTLQESLRADSPTNDFIDDSVDTIVLDEDLASIAREVQARVNRRGDVESGGGPEIVTIKVRWLLNSDGRADVWTLEMKRHDTFHALFEDVANAAGILTSSLVLTHGGARVFASATPHSLKIWAEAQMGTVHMTDICVLDASDVTTFEYLREQRHELHPPLAGSSTSWTPPPGSMEDGESESDVQSVAEEDDDTFKLVVRSGTTKDVTLKVRPTTSCGAIVKAFLRRAGIADKYPEGKSSRKKSAGGPRLMIDGDRMDPDTPISEADLEDGDQVEVTGL
ncbi:hypothetical protein EDB86DRAFT_2800259 [Lactarius hatsudake]|nr:hypothetical protein EDB86DRAFT_2800259 [Lactarius hatsudake]